MMFASDSKYYRSVDFAVETQRVLHFQLTFMALIDFSLILSIITVITRKLIIKGDHYVLRSCAVEIFVHKDEIYCCLLKWFNNPYTEMLGNGYAVAMALSILVQRLSWMSKEAVSISSPIRVRHAGHVSRTRRCVLSDT
ncbi:uncharacterized protein LOC107269999 [Cephus cinctus]|uniref:Uncharacterized protein LOC107269999 n=1 Tax=Cephus cinctus TaxID=211228 RepID=A0AAJ7RLJ1_CEPCN|nr:uncharacterized protein LOC107269999 [Cephus cinctus]XP_024943197.1 uncharacterized protein LOC107269999 [Cephus cinctus]